MDLKPNAPFLHASLIFHVKILLIHSPALTLIQVAAISGDARRALEICRRAAELADYQSKQSVESTMGLSSGLVSSAGT